MDRFLSDLKAVYEKKNNCIIAVSEGIRYADGTFVSEAKTSSTDGFGHAQLGGLAAVLADVVKRETGAKVRGIELSLLQRAGAHIASQTDIDEAFLAGKEAVLQAVSGVTGKMIGFERDMSGGKYVCRPTLLPLDAVANAEKKVPDEWINSTDNGVTQEFIDYVLPLIQGENHRVVENGMPRFAHLKKIRA